jgi:hypothetical protein
LACRNTGTTVSEFRLDSPLRLSDNSRQLSRGFFPVMHPTRLCGDGIPDALLPLIIVF